MAFMTLWERSSPGVMEKPDKGSSFKSNIKKANAS